MNIIDAPVPPVVLEAAAVASPSLSKKELKDLEKEKRREEKERAKREKEERATLKKEKKVSRTRPFSFASHFLVFYSRRARKNKRKSKKQFSQKAVCVFSYIKVSYKSGQILK